MADPLLLRDYHSQVQTQLCSCYLWVYQPTSPCPTLFCSRKTNLPRTLLIKACKTNADGKVVVGHHLNYRIQASSEQEKVEWMKRIRASISRNPFLEMLQQRRQRVSRKGPVGLWAVLTNTPIGLALTHTCKLNTILVVLPCVLLLWYRVVTLITAACVFNHTISHSCAYCWITSNTLVTRCSPNALCLNSPHL